MMSQLMMKPRLTLEMLKKAARTFAEVESAHQEPSLFGITDGKTVGTYVEQKFRTYLREQYDFEEGSAASGIDFPELGVDVKVTNTDQPQSSCPFQSARQKIYGLGYSLLIFIYDKTDDYQRSLSNLSIQHVIFVSKERTADFQTTTGLRRIIENAGNMDDILAFIEDRRLPIDEIGALELANSPIHLRSVTSPSRTPCNGGYSIVASSKRPAQFPASSG